MSKATDDFFEIVNPIFIENGFKFLKSKNLYIKKENDLKYHIFIKFDGRGGIVFFEWIDVIIYNNLNEIVKFETIRNIYFEGDITKLKVPVMYCKAALDLANDMNLRALGAMEYEEKYPRARIEKSALLFIELVKNEVFPIVNP
jgi:hypothetical protein